MLDQAQRFVNPDLVSAARQMLEYDWEYSRSLSVSDGGRLYHRPAIGATSAEQTKRQC